MSSTDADRRELAGVVSALRAHLEWLESSGAHGTPRGSPGSAPFEERSGGATRASEPEERQGPAIIGEVPSLLADQGSSAPGRCSVTEPASSAAAPPKDAGDRLCALANEVASCTRCPLHQGRIQTVFGSGSGKVPVCFVGEAPGQEEDAQGIPFVGKAGQLLDRMIQAMGLARDEVYICNIVKCRPPNNRKPEPDEMAACIPFLREQLRVMAPQVIVAMGATAVQGLLGTTEGIMRLRGRWRLYDGTVAVMPTFHPAYLLRNPSAKAQVWQDLQAVMRQLGLEVPSRQG